MTINRINEIVEEYFNGKTDEFAWYELDEELVHEKVFHKNVVERLVKTFEKSRDIARITNDYLCALREYLIVFQTSLLLDDSSFADSNKYGLLKNTDGRIYATLDLPKGIKEKFVKEAFQIESTNLHTRASKYLLKTNNFIKDLTGYEKFETEAQKLCVMGALRLAKGFSMMAVLPTGGGKSLITQSIAYQEDGLTLVIVPTISLAQDQEISAKQTIRRITSQEIYSYSSGSKNRDEIIGSIKNRTARLLFISPEALIQNEDFAAAIKKANADKYLKNIVIDEAHIVVEWGDYFRTDYQSLEPWRRHILQDNPDIRTILLSATVDKKTGSLLRKMFSDGDKWIEYRCDALRKEPRYCVVKTASYREKKQRILDMVRKLPHPMIIYTLRPERAEDIKAWLVEDGYIGVETYTGETRSSEREELLKSWKDNDFDLMVATSAFGMGVDKQDVRTVIHEFVPDNPNLFYQELGRGGRDGLPCLSIMCIYPDVDLDITNRTKVLGEEKALGRWNTMYHSPKSRRVEDYVYIDTKIKPQYNLTYVYDVASSYDVQWNINLLLLLRRYDLIDIIDMEYEKDEDRYIFKIKIIDDRLTISTNKTEELLAEVREKEKDTFSRNFSILRKHIDKCDKQCLSEMFLDTYPLVSEYCAGCNSHDYKISDDDERFELRNKVDYIPVKKELDPLFKESAYIITNDYSDSLKRLVEHGIDIILTDDEALLDNIGVDKTDIVYLNFYEFRKLNEERQKMFLNGRVVVFYSSEQKTFLKEFSVVSRYRSEQQIVINVMHEDFVVDNDNKKASAYIGCNVTNELMEG